MPDTNNLLRSSLLELSDNLQRTAYECSACLSPHTMMELVGISARLSKIAESITEAEKASRVINCPLREPMT